MAEAMLEAERVESWLSDSDLSWLDEIECSRLPEGSVGRAEADQMLRLSALYAAIRKDLPKLNFSSDALTTLVIDGGVEGPLAAAAADQTRFGWFGELGETVAAAALGSTGNLGAVLVSCDLLSHKYDYYGGSGRPLVDGYQYFLPAVASYAAAPTSARFADIERGPGWWDWGGYRQPPTKPDTLARAVNRSLTPQLRRTFVGDDRVEQCRSWLFVPAATALDLDLGFLTDSELKSAEDELGMTLEELLASDPEEYPEVHLEYYLEPIHLAYVVGSNLDRLLLDVDGIRASDRPAVAAIEGRHQWIREWGELSSRYAQCWPEGRIRDAIESSPWDEFYQGLPESTSPLRMTLD